MLSRPSYPRRANLICFIGTLEAIASSVAKDRSLEQAIQAIEASDAPCLSPANPPIGDAGEHAGEPQGDVAGE